MLVPVPGKYGQTKRLGGTQPGLDDAGGGSQAAGADIRGLLAGICWEDAEGGMGLLKRNPRPFCGETKMEILTLSEDQKWTAEPGLTLMNGEQKKGLSGGPCPQFIHFLPIKTTAVPGGGSSKAHLILTFE